jgi:Predicted transcriptional regulators
MGLPIQGATAVPVPMTFKQIADDMAVRITTGEYPPGARLPSYRELAAMYSVGITTVSRVYGLLVDRGLVVGSQGRGMFVTEPGD